MDKTIISAISGILVGFIAGGFTIRKTKLENEFKEGQGSQEELSKTKFSEITIKHEKELLLLNNAHQKEISEIQNQYNLDKEKFDIINQYLEIAGKYISTSLGRNKIEADFGGAHAKALPYVNETTKYMMVQFAIMPINNDEEKKTAKYRLSEIASEITNK